MDKRVWLLASLILVLIWIVWGQDLTRTTSSPEGGTSSPNSVSGNLTPEHARHQMRQRYSRRPDARFIEAARQLDANNQSGWFSDAFNIQQKEYHWQVVGNDWSLEIDGLAGFGPLMEMARKAHGLEATPVNWQQPQDSPGFDVRTLFERLDRELNTPASISQAAQAAVRLAWLTEQRWHSNDEFAAAAIRLLVEAEGENRTALLEERSLLAAGLGYEHDARRLAEQLPEDNAWRAYIQDDGQHLAQLAESGNRDAHLLHARWLTERRSWPDFQERLDTLKENDLPLAEAQLAYLAGDFASLDLAFRSIPAMTQALVSGNQNLSRSSKVDNHWAEKADEFEQQLARQDGLPGETSLGRQAAESLLRSWYYDTLLRQYFFHLDLQSRPDRARAFAEALAGNREAVPRAMGEWLVSILDQPSGQATPLPLSGSARQRSAQEAISRMQWGHQGINQRIAQLADSLDGRPDHTGDLTDLLLGRPSHLALTDRLLEAEQERIAPGHRRVWIANYLGDNDYLAAAIHDPAYPWAGRQLALRLMRNRDKDPVAMEAAHREQIERRPDRLTPYADFADYLADQDQYHEAIGLLEAWLSGSRDQRDTFARQEAIWRISALYRQLGEPDRALKVLEPFADSYRGGILAARARALYELGETRSALRVAAVQLNRYPKSDKALQQLLELHWLEGEYDQAAALLRSHSDHIDTRDWGPVVGSQLLETYEQCTPCLDSAVAAMREAGIHLEALQSVIGMLRDVDQGRTAFRLFQSIQASGRDRMQLDLRSATQLLRHTDEEEASQWLAGRVRRHGCGPFVPTAYNEQGYLWLWTITEIERCRHGEAIWILRAAALLEPGVHSPERHRQAVAAADNIQNPRYRAYMTHLLGTAPPAELASLNGSRRDLVSAAYYLGIRAFADGEPEAGAEWFQVVLEHGRRAESEYRWAYSLLHPMAQRRISLQRLAEQGNTPASEATGE